MWQLQSVQGGGVREKEPCALAALSAATKQKNVTVQLRAHELKGVAMAQGGYGTLRAQQGALPRALMLSPGAQYSNCFWKLQPCPLPHEGMHRACTGRAVGSRVLCGCTALCLA